MDIGTYGKITTRRVAKDKFEARVNVRDEDGQRRTVRRGGKSAEDAERTLKKHLKERVAAAGDHRVNEKTTLADLFTVWVQVKIEEGSIKPQTVVIYQQAWNAYGLKKLGALRIRELRTDKADRHLKSITAQSGAVTLRKVLKGMYALAVRFGVVTSNPIDGAKPVRAKKKTPARAVTPTEYAAVVAAIEEYTSAIVPGPPRGKYLMPLVELLMATGGRINEVLAADWQDIDLLAEKPILTITGTLVGHVPHRQDSRKNDTSALTVVLPAAAVEALTELFGETGPDGLVFKNRRGGPMSAANLRRSLRAALPEELSWITPKSFRSTVATVVRDELGVEAAQAQLGHARLSTTEGHYVQPRTMGPDSRDALDVFMGVQAATDESER